MSETTHLRTTVPSDLARKLKAIAAMRGVTMQQIVRDAVSKEVARAAFSNLPAKKG